MANKTSTKTKVVKSAKSGKATVKPVVKKKRSRKKVIPLTPTQKLFESARFRRSYVWLAACVLLLTTIAWSWLGASVHVANADQLIDAYIFESGNSFTNGLFPDTHTFLLKWPLFWLIKLAGFSSLAFTLTTIGLSVVTVGFLALLVLRIERRPLVIGTLYFALAAVLWLVPTLPYAGGLLPVNMAMVTTRNLEYVLYIAAIILVLRAPRARSWSLALASLLMGLLIVSDKLFLSFGFGAAAVSALLYVFKRREQLLRPRYLLLATAAGGIVANLLVVALGYFHVTHVVGDSVASPYGAVNGLTSLLTAGLYALLGLLTNFGANAAYDALTVGSIAHNYGARLALPGGVSYLVNLAVLSIGAVFAVKLVRRHLQELPKAKTKRKKLLFAHDRPAQLSVLLLASSVVSVGLFIVANHYYPVDARYMAISLFALFVTTATYLRSWQVDSRQVVLAGAVLLFSIVAAIPMVVHNYQEDRQALDPIAARNHFVNQLLAKHQVKTLVGDYWRVVPIRQGSENKQAILPLQTCTQPRAVLSSAAWVKPLRDQSFAYLLSYDKGLTDFPACDLQAVVKEFGRPNAAVIVSGTLTNPREQLLFFDQGLQASKTPLRSAQGVPSTVVPVPLSSLKIPDCLAGSVVQVVAHEDDDLLFMNPQTQHDIQSGKCLKTIFVTAGDSGYGKPYWVGREQGAEAAYAHMLGLKDVVWIEQLVQLPDSSIVTIAHPKNTMKIALVFMHLPDGNLRGNGFKANGYQSLAKLDGGEIDRIKAVDDQAEYSSGSLRNALAALLLSFKPTEVRSQSNYAGVTYEDHSDHRAVARLTRGAFDTYRNQGGNDAPLSFYTGYPVREQAINVSGYEAAAKLETFLIYGKYDGGVCKSADDCAQTPTYGSYLQRQYVSDY